MAVVKVFSVILPTYGRPDFLRSCLSSLLKQDCEGDYEVLVVHRGDDHRTLEELEEFQEDVRVVPVLVRQPGFISAIHAGVTASTGELVAFTDDDAVYPPHWLASLGSMLEDPRVVGAGGAISEEGMGRDVSHLRGLARITYSGRLLHGFYDRLPAARIDVDFLCGANMAYRRSALSTELFPSVLQLQGGAPLNESFACAILRRRGGRIVCDTELAVTHLRAPRLEGSRAAERNSVRQLACSRAFLMRHALNRPRLFAFIVRMLFVGDRLIPGLLVVLLRRGNGSDPRSLLGTLHGFVDAWRLPRIHSTH